MIKKHHPQSRADRRKLKEIHERTKAEKDAARKLRLERLKLEEAEHVLQEVKAGRQEGQDLQS